MEAFEQLKDPRDGKAKRHYFGEVLFIALAALVSGMEGFDDFERFAKLREKWLRKWLKLPHGTPSSFPPHSRPDKTRQAETEEGNRGEKDQRRMHWYSV